MIYSEEYNWSREIIWRIEDEEKKKISDDEILTEFQNKNNNLKDITIDDTEEDDDREYLYAGWKNAVEATRIFKHKINENL